MSNPKKTKRKKMNRKFLFFLFVFFIVISVVKNALKQIMHWDWTGVLLIGTQNTMNG